MSDLTFNISGVPVVLSHLSPSLVRQFRSNWKEFLSTIDHPARLRVRVSASSETVPSGQFASELTVKLNQDNARFTLPEGHIELDETGLARMTLASGGVASQYHAVVNLLCAAMAWILPSDGTVLLHAAGVVLEERAFVMVGPSGSGKTTWATLAKQAGAMFLSDDLLFVDASGPGAEVLSTPFRANHPRPHGPARWPLAAILLPVHGSPSSLAPANRLEVISRLTANLPFMSQAFARNRRLEPLIEHLADSVQAFHLTFSKDRRFLEWLQRLAAPGV